MAIAGLYVSVERMCLAIEVLWQSIAMVRVWVAWMCVPDDAMRFGRAELPLRLRSLQTVIVFWATETRHLAKEKAAGLLLPQKEFW